MCRKLIFIMAVLVLFVGCTTSEQGETVIDPNFVVSAEGVVETGAGIAAVLAPLLGPVSGLVSGGLLTALGLWRKVKPRIMNAETKAEVGYAVSTSLVEAIERLKKESPQDWERLKPLVNKAIATAGMDPKVLDNMIRGIRGLPPKG
jgi:hypothetical protein